MVLPKRSRGCQTPFNQEDPLERDTHLNRTRVVTLALCLALGAAAALPTVAGAKPRRAAAETVTLKTSKARVRYGNRTLLSGAVKPASADQVVEIVDKDGRTVAEDTTNGAGEFKLWFGPRKNSTLTAQWMETQSAAVRVKVRPVAVVRLGAVRPFARTTVRGNVRPWMPDGSVTLKLNRYGKKVSHKTVSLKDGRWFRGKLNVPKAGRYRAKAIVRSPDHLREAARSSARSASMPRIELGSRGPYVKLLERRLRDLGYYLPRADRFFDFRTRDALIAFNKAQRRARVGTYVDGATWAKLQDPRRPRPRFEKPRSHIEIDQTRQLLYVVARRKVKWILHASTGARGATRDGSFRVTRKLAGYSGNRLYYPSYFDGLRAIHGWPEVPTYPASHGCSRVPMWAATWIFGFADIGTRVYVYH
jgi:hypothetical protein